MDCHDVRTDRQARSVRRKAVQARFRANGTTTRINTRWRSLLSRIFFETAREESEVGHSGNRFAPIVCSTLDLSASTVPSSEQEGTISSIPKYSMYHAALFQTAVLVCFLQSLHNALADRSIVGMFSQHWPLGRS